MKNNKKQALINQKSRFRMHKSGKFWIFSSLTQMTWLNLGKKSQNSIRVHVEQMDNEYQQIYSNSDDDEAHSLSRSLKVAGGIISGIGIGILGHVGTQTHASADTPHVSVEKNLDGKILANKDSVEINLTNIKSSTTDSTSISLTGSDSSSTSDSILKTAQGAQSQHLIKSTTDSHKLSDNTSLSTDSTSVSLTGSDSSSTSDSVLKTAQG
ncbi:KxYKxGKxW signal peptide domain-containing protein, partial [Lactococcus lactis]